MAFQENYHEDGQLTEGRLYFVNPSLTTAVNVKVTTPLMNPGLDDTIVVNPGASAYIEVPYSLHCVGSRYQNKGTVCLEMFVILLRIC
jgi:hypothetical protein